MKVGMTRIKLAKLLEIAFDVQVNPEDLIPNKEASPQNDQVVWSGRIGVLRDIQVHSWDSMTNIVKRGMVKIVDPSELNKVVKFVEVC